MEIVKTLLLFIVVVLASLGLMLWALNPVVLAPADHALVRSLSLLIGGMSAVIYWSEHGSR